MRLLMVALGGIDQRTSVGISSHAILEGFKAIGVDCDVMAIGKAGLEITKAVSHHMPPPKVTHKRLKEIIKHVFLYDSAYRFTFDLHGAEQAIKITESMGEYDCLLSVSDPVASHILAKKLLQKGIIKPCRWIQHWGDPLAIDVARRFVYPKWLVRHFERQILKKADKVIYVTPLTAIAQKEHFTSWANKIAFVPLPYDKPRIYEKPPLNAHFTVAYLGSYNGRYRDIWPLYQAAELCGECRFNLIGNGNVTIKNTDNVSVVPRISFEETFEYEASADLLVVVCNRLGTQIPGKIYYYAATNKPILVILDGPYASEIISFFGTRFDYCRNIKEDIAKAIEKIRETPVLRQPESAFRCEEIARKILEA